MSAAKKLCVVFGATGQQGGSVINHILNDPKAAAVFKLRGITRDPSKPAVQALAARGVECVTADLNDKESLLSAVKGADAVYAVTDYWNTMSQKTEEQQGRNIADACKEAGVGHLVFSTLFNVNKLTKGKFPNVYHFDGKANIADYIKQIGVPTTSFMPGLYMSGLVDMFHPIGKNGAIVYMAPYSSKTPIPLLDAVSDTGLFVKNILMKKDQTLGKEVYAATAYYTPENILEDFKKAFPAAGFTASFKQLTPEQFKGALASKGIPDFIQEEVLENMLFMEPFGYFGKNSLDWSHSLLDAKPTTFEEFAKKQKKWADLK